MDGVQWTLGAGGRILFMLSSPPDASERLLKKPAFLLHSENGFLLCPVLYWGLAHFLESSFIPTFSYLSHGIKLNRFSHW